MVLIIHTHMPTVTDPRFQVGGPTHWGRRPLMWALFSGNICENERITFADLGGARHRHPLRGPILTFSLKSTHVLGISPLRKTLDPPLN